MNATIRRAAHSLILGGVATAVALIPAAPTLRLFAGGECQDPAACRQNADVGRMADEMIAEQVAKFRCAPVGKGIPSSALVRDSKGDDSGVVRVASFNAAWMQAKAGRIYVVRWCA